MTEEQRAYEKAICEVAHVNDIGDVSDGFHTFNQLYHQRAMLFAALVNQNRDISWKTRKHEDGEPCFGGGWFLVTIDTPEGAYGYHYEDKYWDVFHCKELEKAKHWDGYTEENVDRLMSLPDIACPLKAAKCDNRPLPINEEMGVHNAWYVEARKQRIDSLEGFINHLMNDYIHDYGTVCHAIAASMMAALYAANETEHGGITGFQAGAVMWEVIRHMIYPNNKTGLRIINYDDMLFPQYGYKFTERKISKDMFKALQKEAAERLETESDHAHPKVIAHWQSIVDGAVPFGYEIEKEPEERIAEEMKLEEQALLNPQTEE